MSPRQIELAARRERLVALADLQRDHLRLQWQDATAPLVRAQGFLDRSRSWLVPTLVAVLPVVWALTRRRIRVGSTLVRWGRWIWPVWKGLRLTRQWLKEPAAR
jgi:hypothetical protein